MLLRGDFSGNTRYEIHLNGVFVPDGVKSSRICVGTVFAPDEALVAAVWTSDLENPLSSVS